MAAGRHLVRQPRPPALAHLTVTDITPNHLDHPAVRVATADVLPREIDDS